MEQPADQRWVAVSPVSARPVYAGVVEHSVYVHPAARGQGTGRALLDALIDSAKATGIWMIQSWIGDLIKFTSQGEPDEAAHDRSYVPTLTGTSISRAWWPHPEAGNGKWAFPAQRQHAMQTQDAVLPTAAAKQHAAEAVGDQWSVSVGQRIGVAAE
jgi:hypothetical protein